MPPASDDHRVLVMEQGTGNIYVRIKRDRYVIEPPLLGELRQLELVAESVMSEETEQGPATLTIAANSTGDEDAPPPQSERNRTTLPWWRKLFELCEVDGKPLPEDDLCPPWMGNGLLIVTTCMFWQRFPFGDPGSGPGVPNEVANLLVDALLHPQTASTLTTGGQPSSDGGDPSTTPPPSVASTPPL